MESLSDLWDKVKQHPYMLFGGVVLGLIILYWIFTSGSSSRGSTDNTAASEYASQTAAATQLASEQAAAQAANTQTEAQLQAISDQYSSQEAIAQIASNTTLGQAQIAEQLGENTNSTQLSEVQAQIAGANKQSADQLAAIENSNETQYEELSSQIAGQDYQANLTAGVQNNEINQTANSANLATTLSAQTEQQALADETSVANTQAGVEQSLISAESAQAAAQNQLEAFSQASANWAMLMGH